MTLYAWVHAVHLLAACIWVGGLITLAALVPALRRAGADRELLRAAARQFSRLSWPAMLVAIGTGIWQVQLLYLPWSYPALHPKLTAVGLAVALTLGHQLTARRTSARARGIIQGLILVVSLAIVVAAVRI